MIIQNVITFETNRKVYNFLANSEDKLPYKLNKTLPEDAVNGSIVFVVDQNVTYVYRSEEVTVPTKRFVERWLRTGSGSTTTALVAYASSPLEIVVPETADALRTAIAAGISVNKVSTNGTFSEVTYGSTAGTNYSITLPVEGALDPGDHVARLNFKNATYGVQRYEIDSFNCPSINLAKAMVYSPGQASQIDNDAQPTIYEYVPYTIVTEAKSAPDKNPDERAVVNDER